MMIKVRKTKFYNGYNDRWLIRYDVGYGETYYNATIIQGRRPHNEKRAISRIINRIAWINGGFYDVTKFYPALLMHSSIAEQGYVDYEVKDV